MRKLIIIFFLFISFVSNAQVYQEMPQYGYRANRMAFDSTLQIPTVCGVPTLKSVVSVNKKAAIAFDSCNNIFYQYNPKTLAWSEISGGGGGATPTLQQVLTAGRTELNSTSNFRITLNEPVAGDETKVFHSEYDGKSWIKSELFLSNSGSEPYFNFGVQEKTNSSGDDWVELRPSGAEFYRTGSTYSSKIAIPFNNTANYTNTLPKANGVLALTVNGQISDAAGNIAITIPPAIDTTSLSNRINLKLNISDTGTMLTPYLRKVDTTNKFVNSVTKLNDSTLQVIKGTTTTNLSITGVSYAAKLKTLVYNNSGDTITKGSVVYINGRHSSNLATIALAEANNEANSYKTFALVETDILNNASGYVIQAGKIENLNLPTATYTDGDILYLSPTVAGGFTITKPLAPDHICKLGSVTRAHPTLGSIEIKIENGWQLDELSDVQIALVPADSTLLQFSRVDSLWHDVSVTNAIGTKYLKPSDTTTTIATKTNLALKLNTSDSTIYYTKYRSDTSRTNIYSAINSRGYSLNVGGLSQSVTSAQTIYFGHASRVPAGSGAIHRVYIPQSGTIKRIDVVSSSATAGTSESWTLSVRLNNSTNTSIASVATAATTRVWTGSSLSIAVNAGDYIEITTTNPTWATAPGATSWYGTIYIQ